MLVSETAKTPCAAHAGGLVDSAVGRYSPQWGSYVFGMFLGPSPSLALGVGAGAAAGLFWVAGSIATNDVFERRPIALTLINGGYHTVRFTLIGLAFALLG